MSTHARRVVFPIIFGCVEGGFTRLRTGATIAATPGRRKGLKLLGTKVSSPVFPATAAE